MKACRKGFSVLLIMALCFTMVFMDCGMASATTERGKVKAIKYMYPASVTYEENTNGQWSLDENDECYYRYHYATAEPEVFTVEYENGEVVTYSNLSGRGDAYFSEHSYRADDGEIVTLYNCVRSNQEENHFNVGKDNYFTFQFEGAETKIPVRITPQAQQDTNIVQITYEPKVKKLYYTMCSTVYNGEKDAMQLYFPSSYCYYNEGDKLTVTDKNRNTKEYMLIVDEETGEGHFVTEDGEKLDGDVNFSDDQDLHEWGYEKDCYYLVEYGGVVNKVAVEVNKNAIKSISLYIAEDKEEPMLDCDEEKWNVHIDGIIVHYEEAEDEVIRYRENVPVILKGETFWLNEEKEDENTYYESGYFDENGKMVDLQIKHEKMKERGQWYVYYQGVSCEIPTSHSNVTWELKEKPTCSKKGIYEKRCVCEEVLEIGEIPVEPTIHSFTNYTYNNDAAVGKDGTETAICDYGCGTTDTRTKKGTALSGGGSSGGGIYIPPIQKPEISSGEGYTTKLSNDGKTADITVNEDYELVDVSVNGISKGNTTTLEGLKTGDKIVITVISEVEKIQNQLKDVTKENLRAHSKQVKLKNGKKAVKITWTNTSGVKFDGVEIFRSLKKNSGYGKNPIYTSKSGKYYNTSVKKGKKYYYKVRSYIEVDGVKYYSAWSAKAWRSVK